MDSWINGPAKSGGSAWITPADEKCSGRRYGSISYGYAETLAARCVPRRLYKTFKSTFAGSGSRRPANNGAIS